MKRLMLLFLTVVMLVCSFPGAGFAAVKESDLEVYLSELRWTEAELETYLWEYYDLKLRDFDSLEELKDFLGPVITEESLQQLLDDYGLTRQQLDDILAEYGETVEDYTFIDDIEFYLIEETIDIDYEDMFSDFGLSDEELDRLFLHLESLDDEAIEGRLGGLYERLMAFEEFESATELSAGQIAELLSIMQEMLDLFEIDATFFLVKSGEEMPVTLADLIQMTDGGGYDLKIVLHNLQGEFLADFILTNEMFGSELLQETAKDLPTVEQAVTAQQAADKPEAKTGGSAPEGVEKTVKGERLPVTSGEYLSKVFAGLSVMGIGAWFVLYFRRQGA
ncbi:processed acidic surface protein [Halobacillus litoralis]|uniref:processed acidic surface protein n=1 Tax=Halobacillus litoralis TaxID=45668 RepID=UPI001CFCAF5F|nr:processed acidic surface protein [Halobacillus litoralis]WLR47284.1 processed acidic surface protein [Halobacillus litoralis]